MRFDKSDPMSVEPSGDMREAARHLRGIYAALVQEGFNDRQALVIIGQMLAGSMRSDSDE